MSVTRDTTEGARAGVPRRPGSRSSSCGTSRPRSGRVAGDGHRRPPHVRARRRRGGRVPRPAVAAAPSTRATCASASSPRPSRSRLVPVTAAGVPVLAAGGVALLVGVLAQAADPTEVPGPDDVAGGTTDVDRRAAGRRRAATCSSWRGCRCRERVLGAPDGRAGRRPDPGRAAGGAGRRAGVRDGPRAGGRRPCARPRLRRGGRCCCACRSSSWSWGRRSWRPWLASSDARSPPEWRAVRGGGTSHPSRLQTCCLPPPPARRVRTSWPGAQPRSRKARARR